MAEDFCPVVGIVCEGGARIGGGRAIRESDASEASGAAAGGELTEAAGEGGLSGAFVVVVLWVLLRVCVELLVVKVMVVENHVGVGAAEGAAELIEVEEGAGGGRVGRS